VTTEQPTGFSEQTAPDQPASVMILTTGVPATSGFATWIKLPQSGSLFVFYETQDPTANAYLWQTSGSTPIKVGPQTLTVNAGDALVYQIADVATNIKLVWGYN
jgi:hypothetical protein